MIALRIPSPEVLYLPVVFRRIISRYREGKQGPEIIRPSPQEQVVETESVATPTL